MVLAYIDRVRDQFVPPSESNVLSEEDRFTLWLIHSAFFNREARYGELSPVVDEKRKSGVELNTEEQQVARHEAVVEQHVAQLLAGLEAAESNLAQYEVEAQEIRQRYDEASRIMQERDLSYTMENWIGVLNEVFPDGVQVVTDMDLTLTSVAHLDHIPGSSLAESYMAELGRETFPVAFARYWEPLLQDPQASEIFAKVGQATPKREGVDEFLAYAQEMGIPVSVLSANFRPLVEGFVSKLQGVQAVYAVDVGDVRATDKSTMLRWIAYQSPHRALLYCGDGGSDKPAMDERASQVVGGYFALKGGSFEKELDKSGFMYQPYETFGDIHATIHGGLSPADTQ